MNRKFIDTKKINGWDILTDDGFKELEAIHITIPYKKWKLKTESKNLNCANDHIVFVNNNEEKFVKDLNSNDLIITDSGLEKIIEIIETSQKINMYDAEINDPIHRYYTNGILSHNTSTLKILSKGYTTLYIDASSEGSIDVIRDRIGKFCSTMSLMGEKESLKCVVLDEMDGASESFFKALRGVMEKYHRIARFIASCNFIAKIPDPIQSRFNCISFDPINNEEEEQIILEYKVRVKLILDKIGVVHTPEILDKFVRNDFPDMRSLMNKLNSYYLKGIKELNDKNFNINYDYVDLFNLCMKGTDKPHENYKFIVSEYSSKIDSALGALGQDFIEYLKTNHPHKLDKLPGIIITVAEHQAQRTLVIDPLVTLLSCVMKIQTILK